MDMFFSYGYGLDMKREDKRSKGRSAGLILQTQEYTVGKAPKRAHATPLTDSSKN